MMTATAAPDMIPDPPMIRRRLYQLRTETRLLARLLRISEDKAKVLPPRLVGDLVTSDAGKAVPAGGREVARA